MCVCLRVKVKEKVHKVLVGCYSLLLSHGACPAYRSGPGNQGKPQLL